MECLWLIMVLVLPLLLSSETAFLSQDTYSRFDVPKTVFLKTITALIVSIWLICNIGIIDRLNGLRSLFQLATIREHFKIQHILIIGVGFALLSSLLATLLSGDVETSLWGSQPGNDPFSLYSTLCYLAVFGVLASSVKTHQQITRLLWAILISGTVVAGYGLLEYLGMDFLNTNETAGYWRIGSTFGNSLVAGSFLLLPIGVALTVICHLLKRTSSNQNTKKLLLTAAIISSILLITAMIFTNSRGPWIATGALLAIFIVGNVIFNEFKGAMKTIGLILGIIIISFATSYVCDYVKFSLLPEISVDEVTTPNTGNYTTVVERASTIPSVITEGSLNSRLYIWQNAYLASQNRHAIPNLNDYGHVTRFIFGYGPELMEFAFLQTAQPHGRLMLPGTPDQAHNIFLHYLVDQGIVGLFATLVLFGTPGLIIIWLITTKREKNLTSWWIPLGCAITLVSHTFEQQAGISKVSDITLYFVILGILYASLSIEVSTHPTTSPNSSVGDQYFLKWKHLAIVVIFVTVLIPPTIYQNINSLRSGFIAGKGAEAYATGNWKQAHELFNKAILLSPRIPFYYHYQNAALVQLTKHIGEPYSYIPPECVIYSDKEKIINCVYGQIYLNAKNAYIHNGLNWNTTYEAAESAFVIKRDEEALSLYSTMVTQVPNSYPLRNHAGRSYYLLSKYEEALNMFTASLDITGREALQARTALMYIGFVQIDTDQPELAYNNLVTSLDLYLQARHILEVEGKGFSTVDESSREQENNDILSISIALNNLAPELGKEPPVKIE